MLKLQDLCQKLEPMLIRIDHLAEALSATKVNNRVTRLIREFLPGLEGSIRNQGAMYTLAAGFYRRFFPLELGTILDESMEDGTDEDNEFTMEYFEHIRIAPMGVHPEHAMYTTQGQHSIFSYAYILGDVTEFAGEIIEESYAGTLRAMHSEELEMGDNLGEIIEDIPQKPFKLQEIRGALTGTRFQRFTEVVEYAMAIPDNIFVRKNTENRFELADNGPWTWENVQRLTAEWKEGERLQRRAHNAGLTWEPVLEKQMARILKLLIDYREKQEGPPEEMQT